jgi:glycosyltransferase involved in cell wall biosynthesis
MEALPDAEGSSGEYLPGDLSGYRWIICVGPWHSPIALIRAFVSMKSVSRLIYLPRGGLCQIEFVRLRDIKKYPYFAFIEIVWILLARKILFSSKLEQNKSVFPTNKLAGRSRIAPDFFLPSWSSDRSAAESRAEEGGIVISFLAEIHPRKGLAEFIQGLDAWRRAQPHAPNMKFRVAGGVRAGCEKYMERLVRFVEKSGLSDFVEFLGPLAHHDRAKFYRDTDIFVATSRFESFGLTVLEALHSGCVTLTGRNLGVLEYVADNPDLVVCDSLTEEDIVLGLQRGMKLVLDRTSENSTASSVAHINELALLQWQELLDQ